MKQGSWGSKNTFGTKSEGTFENITENLEFFFLSPSTQFRFSAVPTKTYNPEKHATQPNYLLLKHTQISKLSIMLRMLDWKRQPLTPTLRSHTCGMPYLSIICQIYQSSFLEAFRNLKVVTKAYSSGRPCGNTSLAWGGKKRAMYQA